MPSAERFSCDEVATAFGRRYGRRPQVLVRAPGRVSLLGAHVDYSEGWVISGAIDRAVWLAAAATDGLTRIAALDLGETATLDLARLPPPVPERTGGGATGVDLPAGVAWALAEAGHRPPTMDVAFAGNVPIGAGVSSSAAVEMAWLLAWEAVAGAAGFGLDGAGRARLGQRAENGYLGVRSGIMDQFSSLHGAAGQLIFLDCRSLAFEHLPLPPTAAVLVADSGVRRCLVDIDYGDRRQQCREAVAILAPHLPGIRTLRDVSCEDFELVSHHLPRLLRRRARHAVEECRRVRDGAAALRRGDLAAFGRLMRRSHLSSRDLYEVSIPELDVLAAAAWATPGCYGARLSGAGFGGCLTVLAEASAVEAVHRAMDDAFHREFARRPEIFACAVGEGASILAPTGLTLRDPETPDPPARSP